MNDQDRRAIESVFRRIREVEQQGVPRDSDAERLIQQEMQKNPAYAYYLAQTVLIQQDALGKAQERIQALEGRSSASATASAGIPVAAAPAHAASASSASLSAAAFGRRAATANSPSSNLSSAGFGRSNAGSGGGFLAGALQTAMGVAGGMMLGNMLSGLFGGNEAQAGEVAPVEEDAASEYYDEGVDIYGDDGGDW